MTSREGEEGTKESRDDYEADHEGKEPVRRKLPQRRAKLPQMVRRMASGDALGACKVFEIGKSTGTEKVKKSPFTLEPSEVLDSSQDRPLTSTVIKELPKPSTSVLDASPVFSQKAKPRVEEVKEKVREEGVCSPGFLAGLRGRYDSNAREKERLIQREIAKRDFHQSKNLEATKAIDERIKKHLSITEVAFDPEAEADLGPVEISPITPAMEQVTRESSRNWKSRVADSTPESNAVDNSAVIEMLQSDLTVFKQSLWEVCRVTGKSEPHISCTQLSQPGTWYLVEVTVGNEGVQGILEGCEEEVQGETAKMWLEKYQPDWRRLLKPSGSTASALGTGEEGFLGMELADESNISLRVEGEEPNKESSVVLETDEELPVQDELNILKAVSKKMKLEVNAKNQELKGLRARKEKAIKYLHSITSEITDVQKKAEKHREYLEKYQQEEEEDRRRLEALEQEIQERKYRKKELLKVKEQRQARMRHQTAVINRRKARETRLGDQRQNALEQIRIAEEQIADLPNATGYSQEKLNELEDQIAAKKGELECPVCYEEAVPPIYTCVAQHLVCTKCRLLLKTCGECRTPYPEALLRHRWAEKDHQQLVEMRRQRDEVQQKLAKGHQAYVDGEPAENYQEGMSLVLEEGIDF